MFDQLQAAMSREHTKIEHEGITADIVIEDNQWRAHFGAPLDFSTYWMAYPVPADQKQPEETVRAIIDFEIHRQQVMT